MASSYSRTQIQIFSHSHSHQLRSPDFRYDLRKIRAPPREMRRQYDGRAKRLKDHMLRDRDFVQLLDATRGDINLACVAITETAGGSSPGPHEAPSSAESNGRTMPENAAGLETALDPPNDYDGFAADEDAASDDDPDDSSDGHNGNGTETNVITVSCFCEHGKHRSVAFAEELAALLRRNRWDVDVRHNDIDRKSTKKQQSTGCRDHRRAGAGFFPVEEGAWNI